jgi:NAD(P)-dependent dehydrogenase (short-subunit alcohol dehydrogenase family)
MASVLITGANRGLGLGLVRAYLQDGWEVLAACRNQSPELAALECERLEVLVLDLCDDADLEKLAGRLAERPLDVLINNAGRMAQPKAQGFGHFDRSLWHEVFDINLFTPMRLSELLAGSLRRANRGRIVTISSGLGSIAGNQHGGLYAYRASKAGVNAITKSMAIDLAEHGIIAIALSPGWVRTDMGGSGADLDVDESVAGMKRVIDDLTAGDSGKFLSWDGTERPW